MGVLPLSWGISMAGPRGGRPVPGSRGCGADRAVLAGAADRRIDGVVVGPYPAHSHLSETI